MNSRFLRLTLAVLSLAPALACGLSDTITETAFVTSCANECASAGADHSLCSSYCTCGYGYARDHDRLGELENVQVVPGQQMPPILVDLLAECGSDLWDSNFRRECVANCQMGPVCQERCECFLRELRGPGDRRASTRFLVENVDVSPATEAGNQRLDAAEQVCPP